MKADMLGLFSFNFSQNFGKIEQTSIDTKFWNSGIIWFLILF